MDIRQCLESNETFKTGRKGDKAVPCLYGTPFTDCDKSKKINIFEMKKT